ncbi:MAG: hypothetical protein LIP09_06075 [Bacteroidales bacterium]|nr:hypothetical protein [Bacteroidales bacterium]
MTTEEIRQSVINMGGLTTAQVWDNPSNRYHYGEVVVDDDILDEVMAGDPESYELEDPEVSEAYEVMKGAFYTDFADCESFRIVRYDVNDTTIGYLLTYEA